MCYIYIYIIYIYICITGLAIGDSKPWCLCLSTTKYSEGCMGSLSFRGPLVDKRYFPSPQPKRYGDDDFLSGEGQKSFCLSSLFHQLVQFYAGHVGIAIINHQFLMVYTTTLWWLGGWFIIAIPTLKTMVFRLIFLTPEQVGWWWSRGIFRLRPYGSSGFRPHGELCGRGAAGVEQRLAGFDAYLSGSPWGQVMPGQTNGKWEMIVGNWQMSFVLFRVWKV